MLIRGTIRGFGESDSGWFLRAWLCLGTSQGKIINARKRTRGLRIIGELIDVGRFAEMS
ncbi:MAG: hypothetical protein KJ718_00340 [Nanoarchaeota archaeon]|nr:hypothetical protein [Nanoarchaeota archaeon]MBU1050989.1 hypothetical protein [Nanoarchaeota archaeon]MBU1988030.1 hypothetical protein [Nanoarchaeota archaeon]